jgi:hypothetical protein
MEIILKNYELLNAMGSVKSLLQIEDKDFSVKAKWNLMKNMKKFESAYKIYSELDFALIKQYAIKDENGELKLDENNQPKFPPNNQKEYYTKREEVLSLDNTIDILLVKLSDLENHVPNGEILYHLEFMIEDDSE